MAKKQKAKTYKLLSGQEIWDGEPEPPSMEPYYGAYMEHCPRCNEAHVLGVMELRTQGPTVHQFSHWAYCPKYEEPIVLNFFEDKEEAKAALGRGEEVIHAYRLT